MVMSYWQLIFLQCKVNTGAYDGDRLPRQSWDWPRQTWSRSGCVISEAGMTVEKYDEESEQWEKLLREIERK
jgi:hypothetical protein